MKQWLIQRGFREFTQTSFLNILGKKQFGLNETKLFHFHGIFKKNEIKSAKQRSHCGEEDKPLAL